LDFANGEAQASCLQRPNGCAWTVGSPRAACGGVCERERRIERGTGERRRGRGRAERCGAAAVAARKRLCSGNIRLDAAFRDQPTGVRRMSKRHLQQRGECDAVRGVQDVSDRHLREPRGLADDGPSLHAVCARHDDDGAEPSVVRRQRQLPGRHHSSRRRRPNGLRRVPARLLLPGGWRAQGRVPREHVGQRQRSRDALRCGNGVPRRPARLRGGDAALGSRVCRVSERLVQREQKYCNMHRLDKLRDWEFREPTRHVGERSGLRPVP
jgi:hypothetical protein